MPDRMRRSAAGFLGPGCAGSGRNHPLTEVEFIPGGTHCAFNKIDDVIAANTKWLVTALS